MTSTITGGIIMPPITTIPVTITPDATARVEQLGMQKELQTMIDHTREAVPGLVEIGVDTWDVSSEPGEPHVFLVGWRAGQPTFPFEVEDGWARWFGRTFPPDVAQWFSFEIQYRDEHGR
jgi:hypothetical protein